MEKMAVVEKVNTVCCDDVEDLRVEYIFLA